MRAKQRWVLRGGALAATAVGLVLGTGAVAASAHTGTISLSPVGSQSQCQGALAAQVNYWSSTGHDVRIDLGCHAVAGGWSATYTYYHTGGAS